jgi:predicted acylesterase/phospholipase RssA
VSKTTRKNYDFDLLNTFSRSQKKALILAGGGITGSVFEIGCLQALESFFDGFSANDFDTYVGVGAGAFSASCLANGITTEELLNMFLGRSSRLKPLNRSSVFKLNVKEFKEKLFYFPAKIVEVARELFFGKNDRNLLDSLSSLAELLPSGIFDNVGIQLYLEQSFKKLKKPTEFNKVGRELFNVATNLDTGERVVFGENNQKVSIPESVRAATAFPLIFAPVKLDNAYYISGGVKTALHLDVAIDHGADLIICINPIVPIFHQPSLSEKGWSTSKGRFLSKKGLIHVIDQSYRILYHAKLSTAIEIVRKRHPDLDIILFEPRRDDFQFLFSNLFRSSAGASVAKKGYETVRREIEQNFRQYGKIFKRHNIATTRHTYHEDYEKKTKARFNFGPLNLFLRAFPFIKTHRSSSVGERKAAA